MQQIWRSHCVSDMIVIGFEIRREDYSGLCADVEKQHWFDVRFRTRWPIRSRNQPRWISQKDRDPDDRWWIVVIFCAYFVNEWRVRTWSVGSDHPIQNDVLALRATPRATFIRQTVLSLHCTVCTVIRHLYTVLLSTGSSRSFRHFIPIPVQVCILYCTVCMSYPPDPLHTEYAYTAQQPCRIIATALPC